MYSKRGIALQSRGRSKGSIIKSYQVNIVTSNSKKVPANYLLNCYNNY